MGKEFNNGAMDRLFAGTPPREALRYLMHRAATTDIRTRAEDKIVMINDVARAFFEAKVQRDVCVELPLGAMTAEDRNKDLVGKLRLSLHGTRDAAANWQEEVAKEMLRWGFREGKYNPCLYYNEKTGLEVLVHGDDVVSVGSRAVAYDLKKLESRFEINKHILGRGRRGEDRR